MREPRNSANEKPHQANLNPPMDSLFIMVLPTSSPPLKQFSPVVWGAHTWLVKVAYPNYNILLIPNKPISAGRNNWQSICFRSTQFSLYPLGRK